MDDWIKKMCACTHTHTQTHNGIYYSAMRNKEILPFVTTWMNLEDIILTEISQSEKDKYYVVSLKPGI